MKKIPIEEAIGESLCHDMTAILAGGFKGVRFPRGHVIQAEDLEILGLLGASGSGKSLSLRCIAGIIRPDRGHIELNGRTLFDSKRRINLRPQLRRVAYLFQDYALFPSKTVRDNIAYGLFKKQGIDKASEVQFWLDRMQLSHLADHLPAQLSGGQRQRVALARIFINQAELLLLDEPFSALDSFLKWQVASDLREELQHYPSGSIFVSHDRDEVREMVDSVVVIDEGRSYRKSKLEDFLSQPGSEAACRLSGARIFSRLIEAEDAYQAVDWQLTLPKQELKQKTGLRGVALNMQDFNLSPRPRSKLALKLFVQSAKESRSQVLLNLQLANPETEAIRYQMDLASCKREFGSIQIQEHIFLNFDRNQLWFW